MGSKLEVSEGMSCVGSDGEVFVLEDLVGCWLFLGLVEVAFVVASRMAVQPASQKLPMDSSTCDCRSGKRCAICAKNVGQITCTEECLLKDLSSHPNDPEKL